MKLKNAGFSLVVSIYGKIGDNNTLSDAPTLSPSSACFLFKPLFVREIDVLNCFGN